MDIRELQAELARLGLYAGEIDGQAGRGTRAGIAALLARQEPPPAFQTWPDVRRMLAAEQAIYHGAGIDVGAIDGLEGPQTLYAREVWAAREKGDKSIETWRDGEDAAPASVPSARTWPTLAEVRTGKSVFGAPGSSLVTMTLPYRMRLAWDTDTLVSRMTCHRLVEVPLGEILRAALDHYGADGITALRLDLFGGCHADRLARGSAQLSAHAWGIAVDIDPERNQLRWGRDRATFARADYLPFWRIVEAAGGVSLGRAKNYDWMHFQFCR